MLRYTIFHEKNIEMATHGWKSFILVCVPAQECFGIKRSKMSFIEDLKQKKYKIQLSMTKP